MDIRIPHLGEGADTGSIVNIFVKEGDTISKDQTILELENEKAVAPIPASHAGVVKKILVKVGDKVSVGQAVLQVEGTGGASDAPAAPAAPAPSARSAEPARPAAPQQAGGSYSFAAPGHLPPAASPTVRKIAQDLGIDLARVRGSESGGRITVGDLRDYVLQLQQMAFSGAPAPQAAPSAPAAPKRESVDFSKWGPVTKKPLTSLRKKIAEKMTESWTTVPHVTQFDEADITALMALRKKYSAAYEKKGAALTVTPFLMKAAVSALKKYPQVNASLDADGETLVLKEYVHLGVAVDTETGLIVPVLRDADKKSLFDIAKELGELAEKTRQRKVAVDDLKGGSFTISNLGGIGGTFFTPIVNVPELAILGVGKGSLKPVAVKQGDKTVFEPKLLLPLGLSYDHRAVDGADGARFLREIVRFLEEFKEGDVKI